MPSSWQRPLLLLYGGSFDPPHWAHMRLVKHVLFLEPEYFLLMPTYIPPHKTALDVSYRHRFAMLRRGLEEAELLQKPIQLSVLEKQLGRVSYSHKTVAALQRLCPNAQIVLLLGADSYVNFPHWANAGWLSQQVKAVVLTRETQENLLQLSNQNRPEAYFLENPVWPESSTEIRRLWAEYYTSKKPSVWQKLLEYLPFSVCHYIISYKLYDLS